ncbi:hypothetical protein CYY_005910 [Polysphondylium violaceum]|uniref:Deacetylase sirtuin-type domain-containing protein n=1 Tax=Polysphondylium violaceum TaxID=133409 RepID=A0A8J4PSS3_9MYCE|nr:hypothetical protein CYY_005910 [Polysphondylium violaceum]
MDNNTTSNNNLLGEKIAIALGTLALGVLSCKLFNKYNKSNNTTNSGVNKNSNNTVNSDGTQEEFKPENLKWTPLMIASYYDDYEEAVKYINQDSNSIHQVDVNNWTPLHIAVSRNSEKVIDLLLQNPSIDVNIPNNKGYTVLHIACSNGNLNIVRKLLELDVHLTICSNNMESCLYLACSNAHRDIAVLLVEFSAKNKGDEQTREIINQFNIHGVAPIHLVVLKRDVELLGLLLDHGADINAFKKDGSTALHVASIVDCSEAVDVLIERGADYLVVNRYGNSPLHEASIKGNCSAVSAILAKAGGQRENLANLKDKDESTPLHLACNIVNAQDTGRYLKVIKVLIDAGANVNELDAGKATPLHIIACVGEKGTEIMKYLLECGADPTIENQSGWTPLHHAAKQPAKVFDVLSAWCKKHHPLFLSTFDKDKPRVIPVRKPLATPSESGLERLTSIAQGIRENKYKKVIFLTGAGISANAGIPPYRTQDGLYDASKQFSFSAQTIYDTPDVFYDGMRKYFYPVVTGHIKPTPSHHFIKQFQDRGILLRNFTQNVDQLQEKAGVDDKHIVHAHGSLGDDWYCMGCQKKYTPSYVWTEVGRNVEPYCDVQTCRDIIRPSVIFFGEGLSNQFHQRSISDLRECDLLIVMGSSLVVYPFAGLLNDVLPNTPRILINKEPTGPFKSVSDIDKSPTNDDLVIESRGSRDLVILGDCDKGVDYFNSLINQSQ